MNEHQQGPHCPACRGGSSRAVRTHSVQVGSESIYYLTYVWSCLVCGEEWLDDSLKRLNSWAADAARLSVGGFESPICPETLERLAP
jgi:YgiT-type zinc finger domain-containing protein